MNTRPEVVGGALDVDHPRAGQGRQGVLYLDSSAIVKLVVAEPESRSLLAYLDGAPVPVSSALARVEVVRAVRLHGAAAVVRGRHVLDAVHLVTVDRSLLDVAADVRPEVLRSVDAIHVASALAVGDDLRELVTYDRRMAEAAASVGLAVATPGF